MSKELTICLNEDKIYFPGDVIKGYIKLDLKRSSADIQNISLNFRGTIEGNGEKKIIIDKTETLAVPTNRKKYTTFKVGQVYKFDFEFKVPTDKSLPSSALISKIANISYYLTATPKKPSFNFSHSLPVITEEVKIFGSINVNSPDYCRKVSMNTDLGFTNGNKSTQWNITVPKSAFIRGASIDLECNVNNFPTMKKSNAIKVSFIRHVYKTSTAKIVEKKVLSQKTIDLDVTEITSTQSVYTKLHVPSDTPPSVFPDTGRILSVSYIIQAELNMKGVKSSIKLKKSYAQEAAIVIGTFSRAYELTEDSLTTTEHNAPLSNNVSALRAMSTTNLRVNSNLSYSKNHSAVSLLPLPQQQSPLPTRNFHGALTASEGELKPLARLDEGKILDSNTMRRSYLSKTIDIRDDPMSRRTSTLTNMRQSSRSQSASPRMIDTSLTPLPSTGSLMNGNGNIGYGRNGVSRGAIALQPTATSLNSAIVSSSPHEIGPNDIINRGGSGGDYFNADNEKVISDMNYNGEKQQQEEAISQVPHLIRNDTVSTASTTGGMIDEILYSLVPPPPTPSTITNKEVHSTS